MFLNSDIETDNLLMLREYSKFYNKYYKIINKYFYKNLG